MDKTINTVLMLFDTQKQLKDHLYAVADTREITINISQQTYTIGGINYVHRLKDPNKIRSYHKYHTLVISHGAMPDYMLVHLHRVCV